MEGGNIDGNWSKDAGVASCMNAKYTNATKKPVKWDFLLRYIFSFVHLWN